MTLILDWAGGCKSTQSLWMMILKLFFQGQRINLAVEKPDAVLN